MPPSSGLVAANTMVLAPCCGVFLPNGGTTRDRPTSNARPCEEALAGRDGRAVRKASVMSDLSQGPCWSRPQIAANGNGGLAARGKAVIRIRIEANYNLIIVSDIIITSGIIGA